MCFVFCLAPIQQIETTTPGYDKSVSNHQQHQSYVDVRYSECCNGSGDDIGDRERDNDDLADFAVVQYYDEADEFTVGTRKPNHQYQQQNHHHHQQQSQIETSYSTTASEPGDFYDYGWDYETTAGSGQHTPQTPSYHYQVQQQQQPERRRRRRGGRPVRHSVESDSLTSVKMIM